MLPRVGRPRWTSKAAGDRSARCEPVALFGLDGAASTRTRRRVLTSAEVIPGQGAGSPKWPDMYDRLTKEFGVKTVEAADLANVLAGGKATLVDVRQTIEHDEWRINPSVSVPYAIPDPNIVRRSVGYAISIKGGLKVRNPGFVDACVEAVGDPRRTVVLIDTKGGDLTTEPTRVGSGKLDATDSSALRAAFELCQAGFSDVRYVRGGLPAAIEDGGFVYESEKWGAFLNWLDTFNPDQRRLLMYSRLLPDPTNLPGVVGQGAVFTLIGLAYYDVAGIGSWAAENVPGACSFLPVCL